MSWMGRREEGWALSHSVVLGMVIFGAVISAGRADPPTDAGPATEAVHPGEGYRLAGKIRPRHAREIKASPWSVGAETMDRDFTIYNNWKQYLGPLGVKKARIQSGWAKTERQPGQYDWAWLDEIILDMVDQGVEPWVCLCYGNTIYPGGGGTGLGGGLPTSDEALQAWDRFVAAFVRRYKPHVDEWEVWNEPGLRGKNPADAYANLLIRTAEVIHHEQPEAHVIGFAMAGVKPEWAGDVLRRLRQAGKIDLIDLVSYHPYQYNPDDSYGSVARLREAVHSYGPDIQLFQGENGAPSQRGSFGAIANYDWTERRQAKWALRRLLGDLGRDIPSSYFAICDMVYPDRINYKGLLAIHDDKTVHHAKQGYRAVQHLTALFDDSIRRVDPFTARIAAAEDARYAVFGYRSAAGKLLVTIWRSSDPPGKRPDLDRVSLTLPEMTFDHPVWIDLLTGHVYDVEPAEYHTQDGGTVFPRLPVYDSPVVIADRSAVSHVLQSE